MSYTKKQKELIDKLLEEDMDDQKIKKGIEKTKVDNEDIDTSSETSNDKKEEKQINYMDILKHIIPLICLLTIHNKETSFVKMFELIENNEYVYNILIHQTKNWWGKSIDSKIIKRSNIENLRVDISEIIISRKNKKIFLKKKYKPFKKLFQQKYKERFDCIFLPFNTLLKVVNNAIQ